MPIEVMRQAKSITEFRRQLTTRPGFLFNATSRPKEKLKLILNLPKMYRKSVTKLKKIRKNTWRGICRTVEGVLFCILNIWRRTQNLKNDYTAQLNASKGMAGIVKGYKTDLQAAREYIVQIEQENERLKKELKIRREFMKEYNNLRAQVSVELNQIN